MEAPPPYDQVNLKFDPVSGHFLPANCFDTSKVPDGSLLLRSQVTEIKPCSLLFETDSRGVYSYEKVLDYKPDELWNYFIYHLQNNPGLNVFVRGYHTEVHVVQKKRSVDGKIEVYEEEERKIVNDFTVNLDVSEYIRKDWDSICCKPTEEGKYQQFKDALDDYTMSNNIFKSIECNKQIQGWDFAKLRFALTELVKYAGHKTEIEVSFNFSNSVIAARSSHPAMKMAHNLCFKFLCFITCLCVIFWPMYFASRKKISDVIVANYPVVANDQHFYDRNAVLIIDAVKGKKQISQKANL